MLSIWSAQAIGQVPEPFTRTVTTARNAAPLSVLSQNPAPSAGAQLRIEKLAPVPAPPPSEGTAGTSATFTVTSTNDSGAGTLRQAIKDANGTIGADLIVFQIPGVGTQVIAPKSPLPPINEAVTIDGSTASGYTDRPRIQIDGSQAGTGTDAYGLTVQSAACTIRALSITRFAQSGILLFANSTTIDGCYLGVEPDGVTAGGNTLDGVTVYSGSNSIGREGAFRNVISGNGRCGVAIVDVNAAGNSVVNSYIGTNAAGTGALANASYGVIIQDATDAVIGGTLGSRNVISGNGGAGIDIRGISTRRVAVRGNFIGVGANGQLAIPNGNNGIEILPKQGTAGTPSDNQIGGASGSTSTWTG